MASAKSTSTTRRSGTRKGSAKAAETEISPARWAGVALVIAALIGAIGLAVISPSDPDADAGGQANVIVPAAPSPAAVLDTRTPAVQPTITNPLDGVVTGEWDIDVDVELREEELAKRLLTLVILRDGEVIGEKAKPTTGGTEVVGGTRLLEGVNVITAALRGPGGLYGPASEPVTITLDKDAPGLDLTSPRDKLKTFDDTVTVEGTSEAGAEVTITNEAQGFDPGPMVVGPSGTFEMVVPLKKGRNVIVAQSQDQARQKQRSSIVVTRKDGKPVVKLIAPERVKRSSLPRKVRIVAEVTDSSGDKMEGASVSFSIGGDNRVAETFVDETAANGRAVWQAEVKGGSSPVLVGVEVTSPYGQTRRARHEITLK